MNVTEAFSKRLKELRGNMSQEQLAKKLGVSRGSISFYENGDRTPDILFLDSVSKYFGVSTDYLLGYSDAKNDNNIDIGKELPLSDRSIDILRDVKKSLLSSVTVNYILENKKLLSILIFYFVSSIYGEIRKGDFKCIPLSKSYIFYTEKIKFAEIIQALPLIRKDFYKMIINDDNFELILKEYVFHLADIDYLMSLYIPDEIYVNSDLEDWEEPDLEIEEFDWQKEQEEMQKFKDREQFKEDFLYYCLDKIKQRQNKGGEQNANNHTEERDV